MSKEASRVRRRLALSAVVGIALCSPAAASAAEEPTREQAVAALEQAQDVAANGGDLSSALRELDQTRSALPGSLRGDAAALMSRPTDGDQSSSDLNERGYTVANETHCSAHFCLHWVESSDDAIDTTDENDGASGAANGRPDYIDRMELSFEEVYASQHTTLGYKAPPSDGALGGNEKVDVYVKNLHNQTLGFVSPDDGQDDARVKTAYQVMDNNYEDGEPTPTELMKVTAAHEYMHIIQNGYDGAAKDAWAWEAHATWVEDFVYPANNSYISLYVNDWAQTPEQPISTFNSDTNKQYGTSVFMHYLESRYGRDVLRAFWEKWAEAPTPTSKAATDAMNEAIAAIPGANPGTIGEAFADFASRTAEWKHPSQGFADAASYPDVKRDGDQLTPNGPARTISDLDHGGYKLVDVANASGDKIQALSTMPAPDAYVGLVGRDDQAAGTDADPVVEVVWQAAGTPAALSKPANAYERITAVVANGDFAHGDYNADADDWSWSGDDKDGTLAVLAVPALDSGQKAATATVTTVTQTVPVPFVAPPLRAQPPVFGLAATKVPKRARIRSLLKKGLRLKITPTRPVAVRAAMTIDAKTAKKLKLGRKAMIIGSGGVSASKATTLVVRIKGKLKRRLGRARALRVTLVLAATGAGGTETVTRKLTLSR